MASPILVAVCVCFLLYRFYRYMFERPDCGRFPPGPPKLPWLGSYPFLLAVNYRQLHRATEWLARWYRTPVLGFWYVETPAVTVHDMQIAREVLNNPAIDGRPVFPMVLARDPDFRAWGIFFRDGPFWKEQRRFTLRHLRDYGFGRRFDELEAHITADLQQWVDMVRNGPMHAFEQRLVDDDGLVQLPAAFAGPPANQFLKCVLNACAARDEMADLYEAGRTALRFQRAGCMYGRIFSMLQWTATLWPGASGYREVRSSAMALHEFIRGLVVREWRTFEAGAERHFLDRYFKEMHDGRLDSTFGIEQLTHTVVDLIFPPLSAIGATLSFMLLRLLQNPACMERAQRELDSVVGRGRLATLDDRVHLPYVEAVLRESMRLDTIVANNVPHRTLEATQIGGFDVPKDALVLVVLQSAHTDEKVFRDALAFRPERFLNSVNGAFNVRLDKSLPFGAGKRLCAGETFARNMLFLFAAAVLQNFDVAVPEGEVLYDPASEREVQGIIKTPPDFRLKFTSR